jgi:GNAT superfamily N-acetyltransferase
MKIRKAVMGDAAVIARFNRNLARETEHLRLDPKTVGAGVKALIRNRARGIYYMAEDAGQVIGQLCLTYEWSDWRNGNFWWIQSVYVAEKFRGRGIFSALFEHIQALALKDKEVCGLRLYMEKDNERARRAYLKLGLKQTHYQVFEKGLRRPRS